MIRLKRIIAEAVSTFIGEEELEAAFATALANWDFSDQLEAYATKKLEEFEDWDDVISEVVDSMLN